MTPLTSSPFLEKLLTGVLRDYYHYQINNIDFLRYPKARDNSLQQRVRELGLRLAQRCGFLQRATGIAPAAAAKLVSILSQQSGLEETYELLADESSKQWMIALLKFRILGPRHVKLPSNTPTYWQERANLDRWLAETNTVDTQSSIGHLNRYQFAGAIGQLNLHLHPLNILNTFRLEHYAYKKAAPPIAAQPGDIVVDGGGCWGDTAHYFADRVGPTGKVYSFEFLEENLAIFRKNLALNPHLAPHIEIVKHPLWNQSGVTMSFTAAGAGTSVSLSQQPHPHSVTSLTIDDLVTQRGLPRVNFIKLDIEGAELPALIGAAQTLRQHQPRLAISLYHKDDDFITIPKYLHELVPAYEFFLDHPTIHAEETVLFARVRNQQ